MSDVKHQPNASNLLGTLRKVTPSLQKLRGVERWNSAQPSRAQQPKQNSMPYAQSAHLKKFGAKKPGEEHGPTALDKASPESASFLRWRKLFLERHLLMATLPWLRPSWMTLRLRPSFFAIKKSSPRTQSNRQKNVSMTVKPDFGNQGDLWDSAVNYEVMPASMDQAGKLRFSTVRNY